MKKLVAIVLALLMVLISAGIAEEVPFSEWLAGQDPVVTDVFAGEVATPEVPVPEAPAPEAPTSEAPAFEPIGIGSRGETVVQLQAKLIELGILNSKADGVFGPATESALRAVQRMLGNEETGIVQNETELSLILALEKGDGVNLLGDVDYAIEKNNTSDFVESIVFHVDPEIYDLQSFIGRTMTASIYVYSPGDRATSVEDPEHYMCDRFGCHVEIKWLDSNGLLEGRPSYPATDLLSQTVDGRRIASTFTIVPPEGYDTIESIGIAVQSGARPADNNDAVWTLSTPKLELGSFATE